MFQMFAIKCNEGYIRILNEDEAACVGLMKATVFGKEGMERAARTIENAEKDGLTKLRIVELQITEKDPYETPGKWL